MTANIRSAETAKAAILRPTTHFEIVTADNPDMIKTLALQADYVTTGLSTMQHATQAMLDQKKKELIREFQKPLSKKAYAEQLELIKKLKEQGIPTREIIEDKGELESTNFDYYTDQIFATDTGQYYDKNGVLHFIAASFKNKQRQGEEDLAVVQAENFGATIQTLFSSSGKKLTFEGGDIRQMIGKKLFFIGQGHRSDPDTSMAIAQASGYIVVPIKLLQEQFYHLDCCFMPLPCDAAVIYEGEYLFDNDNHMMMDKNGWPMIQEGTATMTAASRELIRTVYPPEKLVLISKLEALAYATNAVVLQNPKNGQFKMFVNGARHDSSQPESQALIEHQISYTTEHMQQLMSVTQGQMDIIETPYSTMHGSGGSVRCTVLELACKTEALTPEEQNKHYFSDTVDKLEARMNGKHSHLQNIQFFQKRPSSVSPDVTADQMTRLVLK